MQKHLEKSITYDFSFEKNVVFCYLSYQVAVVKMIEDGEVYAMKTLNKFEMLKRAEVKIIIVQFWNRKITKIIFFFRRLVFKKRGMF